MSLPAYITSLVAAIGGNELRWNQPSPAGTPVALTYSFLTAAAGSLDSHITNHGDQAGYQPFSAEQITAAQAVMAIYSSVANITFTPVAESNGATAQILFGQNDQHLQGSAGYAYYPQGTALSGDIWLANDQFTNHGDELLPTGYGFMTLLHELGHALGLQHSFADGTFPQPATNPDNQLYTVMSYTSPPNDMFLFIEGWPTPDSGADFQYYFISPQSLMLYDIAAIQYLYGANTDYNSGNTTYTFYPTPFFQCLWDGGGNDTLDFSNFTGACEIDLREGHFSNLAIPSDPIPPLWSATPGDYNGDGALSIAYGALIENATGGSGNDTLTGNAGNNILHGGEGDDTLYSGGGEFDQLYGDAGTDTLIGGAGGIDVLDGGTGADTMTGGADQDVYFVDDAGDVVTELADEGYDEVHSTLGDYTLTANVEDLWLDPGGQNGTGNDGDNTMNANDAANILDGGDGVDYLYGYGGGDTLYGGAGTDTLDGGGDNDAMYGGDGDDTYFVDSAGDVAGELADQGIDTVMTSVDFTLGDNVENLTLIDGAGNINGTGNDLNNVITGNAGNNIIDGGNGDDLMIGGLGDDTYIVLGDDTVVEAAEPGDDTVVSYFTYTLGDNVENLTLADDGLSVDAYGNALSNTITGNTGNNILDGMGGDDIMAGGGGDDWYYVDNQYDSVNESFGEGWDIVFSSVDYQLRANVEQLILTGSDNLAGFGNSDGNALVGNDGDNILDGLGGGDLMQGGLGDDSYYIYSAGDIVIENVGEGIDTVYAHDSYEIGTDTENLILVEGAGDINGTGDTLNNQITGNSGNNVLNGAGGADTMAGGDGDDTYYVEDGGDVITEGSGGSGGVDTVYSALAGYTLGNNVEDLALLGSANINGTGNALNNRLTGNDGKNTLVGGGGNDTLDGGAEQDTLNGGAGDDTYYVDQSSDVVSEALNQGTDLVNSFASNFDLGSNVENLTLLGSSDINGGGNAQDNVIHGNSGANVLKGRDGNDTLDGGAGTDTMSGGVGDDAYYVDVAGDTCNELSAQGTDTVNSTAASYSLGSNVENLNLLGSANINGSGNNTNNVITGNSGNNVLNGGGGSDTLTGLDGNDTLDGGAGIDTMVGGIGNDTYFVDESADVVTEGLNQGTDTVNSSLANYDLGSNLDNLTLTGSANLNGGGNTLDNVVTGNSGNNVLKGRDGNDTLNGGAGVDTMSGGQGNDTYQVDSSSDVCNENSNEGTDTVNSTASYSLGSSVENLNLQGSANLNGAGNNANNVINGNSGNNTLNGNGGNDTLNGGAGADTMLGGAGDDTYVVDNVGDVCNEAAGQGTDTVNSTAATCNLGGDVENLNLLGSGNIMGGGNELANILVGNSGNNILKGRDGNDTLNGGAGNDTMSGGAGNDTYQVDSSSDVCNENSNEGTDTVNSTATYSLGGNVENLNLQGSANLNGNGNNADNIINGNSGNNTLNGGGGNDTLNGGAGHDTLVGASGADKFVFASADNDTISDFAVGVDGILLDNAFFTQLGVDGALDASQFYSAAGAAQGLDANDHLVYNQTSGALYYDADGAGGSVGVLIATLTGSPDTLATTDFTII